MRVKAHKIDAIYTLIQLNSEAFGSPYLFKGIS